MLLIRCQNDFINAQHCNVLPAGQIKCTRPSWLQYSTTWLQYGGPRPSSIEVRLLAPWLVPLKEEVKQNPKIPEGTP